MRNNISFCEGFKFRSYKFKNYKETDNTEGIKVNFLAYMTKGHSKICSEKGTITIKEGDIFFIPKDLKYKSYWYGSPKIEFISLSFSFLPNFENKHYGVQILPYHESIVESMKQILGEEKENAFGVGKLYTLLGEVMHLLSSTKISKTEEVLESARSVLEKNPRLTAKQIAKE